MSHNITTKLTSYPKEIAMRSGEFQLLPSNPALPVILSQPIKNANQYTWVVKQTDGIPTYQSITPTSNILDMLQGTSFSVELRAADPSNVGNPNDLSGLSFRWKKDDAPLYNINNENNGAGVAGLFVSETDSVPSLSGVYACEVSNAYGTVESTPLQINVIDPSKHPKLYKNLILNGDGDGGLNGWQSDSDIIVRPFLQKVAATKHFGSFRLAGFAMIDDNKNDTYKVPSEFYFCLSSHAGLFINPYLKRLEIEPSFADINVKSDPTKYLDYNELWFTEAVMPQIIPNEDFNRSEFAGFFPGLLWMDSYNKNLSNNLIGIYPEFKNTNPTYFTRDKLKFEKFGGKQIATLTQTIDVSDLSNFIDGSAYGIKHLTSQFFAYVGIGITDYKIKIQTADGTRILNYYIEDSEIVYSRIAGKISPISGIPDQNPNFELDVTDLVDIIQNGKKLEVLPNTDIEIIPQCYDKTSITLTYLDDGGYVLKTETINGPDETDIWAVKEKVYFPLTLYSLYEFIKPDNNDIKVFGQKYTNTNAIASLFRTNTNTGTAAPFFSANVPVGTSSTSFFQQNVPTVVDSVKSTLTADSLTNSTTDKVVRFLLNKFDFVNSGWDSAYPGEITYGGSYTPTNKFYYQALHDYGAAAMFGVGSDIVIPKNTRSIKIDVSFNHNSSIQSDTNPEIKNWQSQELYADEYGQNSGTSRRLVEYGYPRCGITKMKLIVAPNGIDINEDAVTYSLPPSSGTVLGLQKAKYADPDAYNTADTSTYVYNLVQPTNLPIPSAYVDPFLKSKESAEFISAQQKVSTTSGGNITTGSMTEAAIRNR